MYQYNTHTLCGRVDTLFPLSSAKKMQDSVNGFAIGLSIVTKHCRYCLLPAKHQAKMRRPAFFQPWKKGRIDFARGVTLSSVHTE